jgi:hypothetical protein
MAGGRWPTDMTVREMEEGLPIGNRRYGRLEICATGLRYEGCRLEIGDTADLEICATGLRYEGCRLEIGDTADWKSALRGCDTRAADTIV